MKVKLKLKKEYSVDLSQEEAIILIKLLKMLDIFKLKELFKEDEKADVNLIDNVCTELFFKLYELKNGDFHRK